MPSPQAVLRACGAPYAETPSRLTLQCPFHDDRTPSAVFYLDRGVFHCFGCEAHGDVVYFYARFKELSREAALHEMADRWGDVRRPAVEADESLIRRLEREALGGAPKAPGRRPSGERFDLWSKAVWAYREGKIDARQFMQAACKIRAKISTF